MKTIAFGVPADLHDRLSTLALQRGVRIQDIFIEAVTLTNPIDITSEDRAILMVVGGMPDAVVGTVLGKSANQIKNWRRRAGLPANKLIREEWAHVLEPSVETLGRAA